MLYCMEVKNYHILDQFMHLSKLNLLAIEKQYDVS